MQFARFVGKFEVTLQVSQLLANVAIAASRVPSIGGEDGKFPIYTVAQALTLSSIGWSLTDYRATNLLP